MRAVICTKYGPPEVLEIRDIPKPIPRDHEILVRVISTAVNSGDVRVRALAVKGFLKIVMRFVLGFSKPRKPVLGTVFSGIVEDIGNKVTKYKIGDKVFGMTGFKFGTYAEYLTINQNSTVMNMPVNADFDEAVSLVFGGQTAIYFLDKMKIGENPNADILIIGATGSVGVSAIQIARHYGANVTAVCSSNGVDLVNKLGVDNTILYDKEDFLNHPEKFDFIFDAVGVTSKKQCRKLLKNGGVFKTVGGMEVAAETTAQLELLKTLFEKEQLKAIIDRRYKLEEIVEAHRYVDTGRKKGNVVLEVSE